MLARNYLPGLLKCAVLDPTGKLDATATRSADGGTLVLQVVNVGDQAIATTIRIDGFSGVDAIAQVTALSGPLDAVNTADKPAAIVPMQSQWKYDPKPDKAVYTFPARSFTSFRWH